jgi:hypothetical protein
LVKRDVEELRETTVPGGVPAAGPGTASEAPSSANAQPSPDRAQKRRGGAPEGNTNAVTHGAYLNEAKRGARATRDRFRRRGEREALAILKASGLAHNPLARLVSRQVGRLEAMVHRLEHHHELRGYFTQGNELKASVKQELEAIGGLLDRAHRLFQALHDIAQESRPKVVEFLLRYEDDPRTRTGPPDEPDLVPLKALPQLSSSEASPSADVCNLPEALSEASPEPEAAKTRPEEPKSAPFTPMDHPGWFPWR